MASNPQLSTPIIKAALEVIAAWPNDDVPEFFHIATSSLACDECGEWATWFNGRLILCKKHMEGWRDA